MRQVLTYDRYFMCAIEGELEELKDVMRLNRFDEPSKLYLETLLGYLENDLFALEKLLEDVVKRYPSTDLSALCQMRVHLRRFPSQVALSLENALLASELIVPEFCAEKNFLLGLYFQGLSQWQRAREHYERASILLKGLGLKKKEIKADLNALMAFRREAGNESVSDLHRFQEIARRAQELGANSVLGVVLRNLSEEFLWMGARDLAVQYAEHSVQATTASFGTRDEFICRIHRLKLLENMGRSSEVGSDYERSRFASFTHVFLVESRTSRPRSDSIRPRGLNVTHEQKLIEVLSKGPRTREEILSEIYSDCRSDRNSKERRLKDLFSRSRKNFRARIVYCDGRYSLLDRRHARR